MLKVRSIAVPSLLCAASFLAISSPALAQAQADDAAAAGASDSGEIVVTAQKRSERLSDVPMTITAQTGSQLRSAGVVDVSQLGRVAPSFTTSTSTFGFPVFALRGVSFNTQQASAPPAVAIYVDQAPLPYSIMTGAVLLDVERIEVLKGPQGTLFGQNATGGLVNVIAAKPTAELHAGLRAEVNHFGQVQTEAFVSGPLGENVRARLSAQTTQFGAWQKGYYLNHDKHGDQNKSAARLLVEWTPTEKLTLNFNLNGNYDRSEAIQPQLRQLLPGFADGANTDPRLRTYPVARKNRDADVDPTLDIRNDNKMWQGVVRADYEFSEAATLTSLTSYVDFDQGGTNFNYDGVALPDASTFVFSNVKSFNQEVRLAGSFGDDKRIQYVLGGSYGKDKIAEGATETFVGYSQLPNNTILALKYNLRARAAAVFGNVDFKVTPRLTLSAGVRETWTRQSINGCTGDGGTGIWSAIFGGVAQFLRSNAGLGPLPATDYLPGSCTTINDNVPKVQNPNGPGLIPDYRPIVLDASQKQKNLSWRGSASYKITPDNMVYATVSRGFKAGVFPVQPTIVNSATTPVTQEKLTSYEVGFKVALMDRKIRLNAAAFHYDYRDKQLYTYIPIPGLGALTSVIINIPKSKVDGFDADVVITPTSRLTLRGAVTYINTEVKAINPGQILYSGVTSAPFNVVGKDLAYSPPWSGTADAEYKFPMSEALTGMVGAGLQFSAKTYSDLGAEEQIANPHYYTIDLRAGVESVHGWRASVFVRNVADKDYLTATYRATDMNSAYAGRPRTFGISGSVDF